MKEDKTKSSDKNNKQGWADSLLNIIYPFGWYSYY